MTSGQSVPLSVTRCEDYFVLPSFSLEIQKKNSAGEA